MVLDLVSNPVVCLGSLSFSLLLVMDTLNTGYYKSSLHQYSILALTYAEILPVKLNTV